MSESLEKQLLKQNEELSRSVAELTQQLKQVTEELSLQREQNHYFLQQLYGRKKETLSFEETNPNQVDLFKDDPSFSWPEQTGEQSDEEMIETTPIRRRKKKGHQKEKPSHLPVIEIIHSEEVVYIPARLENHRHIRYSYTCPSCKKMELLPL